MFGAARLVCAFRSFEGGLHVMCGPSWLACVLSILEGLVFGWARTVCERFEASMSNANFLRRDVAPPGPCASGLVFIFLVSEASCCGGPGESRRGVLRGEC